MSKRLGKRELWGWYSAANEGDRTQKRIARKKKKARRREKQLPPRQEGRDVVKEFYKTIEWKRVRYDALKAGQGRCECCGAGPKEGAVLNVDHIKPVSRFWHLRLELSNLQVLCASCNAGKGVRDKTDWRRDSERPVIWAEGQTWDDLDRALTGSVN